MNLADKTCEPCRGGIPPMDTPAAQAMMVHLGDGWVLSEGGHLERTYLFGDFAESMAFANGVGELAESTGHHPMLHVTWGSCRVEYWTHKIDGLHEADFVMAAKTDQVFEGRQS
jgi:4a-hydroxytetrahydrobiopterin dehydratase